MRLTCIAAMVALGLAAGSVSAEVKINGFASIKAGMTTSADDTLYGYDDSIDLKNESLFALQAQSDLGNDLSVTAQLVSRGSDDFSFDFEWAFLTYQINDEWRVNAGRLRTPFYKYSDFRDVGYAYDWLRTPQSVYDLGFDRISGVSVYYNTSFKDMQSSMQFVYGSYDGDVTLQGAESPTKIDDIMGMTWELSQDWFGMRMAYLRGDVTIQADAFNPLFAALNATGQASVIKAIDFDKDAGSFFGFGMNFDRNDWLTVFEYTFVSVDDSFYANQDSYYLSLGHRFDKFTPYVSFEWDDDEIKPEIYEAMPNAHPLKSTVAGLVASRRVDSSTANVGFRYDFHSSAAFKFELTKAKDRLTMHRDNLVSVGVDVVF